MNVNVITTTGLCKKYGTNDALKGLDLNVPKGSVFGFLGRNGAGKTTTIKILTGLLNPDAGTASVLGYNPVKEKEAVEIKKRTGYVSENPKMYDWMTIEEIIRFTRSFYKNWDDKEAALLLKKFGLDGKKKLGGLSRGMYSQVALLLSLSFKPELLILDEPTSGLDAVVRRDFLESVVSLIQEEGRTVFFSSHQINEVERVADRIAIVDGGKMLVTGETEEIKKKTKKVRAMFKDTPSKIEHSNIICSKTENRESVFAVKEFTPELKSVLQKNGAEKVDVFDMSLEEIFIAYTGERV